MGQLERWPCGIPHRSAVLIGWKPLPPPECWVTQWMQTWLFHWPIGISANTSFVSHHSLLLNWLPGYETGRPSPLLLTLHLSWTSCQQLSVPLWLCHRVSTVVFRGFPLNVCTALGSSRTLPSTMKVSRQLIFISEDKFFPSCEFIELSCYLVLQLTLCYNYLFTHIFWDEGLLGILHLYTPSTESAKERELKIIN